MLLVYTYQKKKKVCCMYINFPVYHYSLYHLIHLSNNKAYIYHLFWWFGFVFVGIELFEESS